MKTSIIGYPRIGNLRELKFASEKYFREEITAAELEQTAKENGIAFRAVHIGSREEAQNAPTPVTNYALFLDGEYITNEQMNDKKFLKLNTGNF